MDEISAWLTLLRAPGFHAGELQELLRHHHSVQSIVDAAPATLRASGARTALIDWLQSHREHDLAPDLEWLTHDRHHFVPWTSLQYPALLKEVADAPIGLYVRGDPSVLALPQLAVVGAVNAYAQ